MSDHTTREGDIVLKPSEYAYVLDKTKGQISCITGPKQLNLSTSEQLVFFNEHTKRFEEASSTQSAISPCIVVPENWYVQLKNPAENNEHPKRGESSSLPSLNIGKKIVIPGNTSFALWPGQMAKVIRGHRLRNNQYLKVRVYDADSANENTSFKSEDGTEANHYNVGDILIIRGTEVPFYIPSTGFEVIPKNRLDDCNGTMDEYVRDALTLKKLEYCILQSESGNREYIHGPKVVFPEPDQKFIKTSDGGIIFDAIELSEISGVYVKVIEEYEEDGVTHPIGEELFITGKDTNIYFPRKEHYIVDYEGRVMHHAIAIPAGSGRYIMNRKTAEIKTVRGPAMYLPDPREEVVAKRYLTKRECDLFYPQNNEVLAYNGHCANRHEDNASYCMDDMKLSRITKSIDVAKGFTRSNTFTEPRSVVLDNKFGAVSISVFSGYAVNVISKNMNKENKVIVGPASIILDYDQTLDSLSPTFQNCHQEVYLKIDHNIFDSRIEAETADKVIVCIDLSYDVSFIDAFKDKWFSIKNYAECLCSREGSALKDAISAYNFIEFYENSNEIIRTVILGDTNDSVTEDGEPITEGVLFEENGMFISDVIINDISTESEMFDLIIDKIKDNTRETLMLEREKYGYEIQVERDKIAKQKAQLELELAKASAATENEIEQIRFNTDKLKYTHDIEIEHTLAALDAEKLERENEQLQMKIKAERESNSLKTVLMKEQANMVISIMNAISPRLIASMDSYSNAELLRELADTMAPLAIAKNESVVDTTMQLLHGTPLEESLGNIFSRLKDVQDELK